MFSFYLGLEVIYKDYVGFVNFICDQYITICLRQLDHRSKNVCMLVYQPQWKDIKLLEESDK